MRSINKSIGLSKKTTSKLMDCKLPSKWQTPKSNKLSSKLSEKAKMMIKVLKSKKNRKNHQKKSPESTVSRLFSENNTKEWSN